MRMRFLELAVAAVALWPSGAMAKACVEPYGTLVQLGEFETVVRIKPECQALVDAQNKGIALGQSASAQPVPAVMASAAFQVDAPVDQMPADLSPSGRGRLGRNLETSLSLSPKAAAERLSGCDARPSRLVKVNDYEFRADMRPECERKSVELAYAVVHAKPAPKVKAAEAQEPASQTVVWMDNSGAWNWGVRGGTDPALSLEGDHSNSHGASSSPSRAGLRPSRGQSEGELE